MVNDPSLPPGRIVVAVGAIVQDEGGRVLLVKHRPQRGGFWQGKWIFPGGKLELGEGIAAGTKREVREGTNLEIEVGRPIPWAERIVRNGDTVQMHVLYITHMAEKQSGELKASSDVGEARWATREELRQLWTELHEDTQRIAELARILPPSPSGRGLG